MCLAPGYNSTACAHSGKNRWRMLTSVDLERMFEFVISWEQLGRQSSSQMPALAFPKCPNCRGHALRIVKTVPFLPSSEFLFESYPSTPAEATSQVS